MATGRRFVSDSRAGRAHGIRRLGRPLHGGTMERTIATCSRYSSRRRLALPAKLAEERQASAELEALHRSRYLHARPKLSGKTLVTDAEYHGHDPAFQESAMDGDGHIGEDDIAHGKLSLTSVKPA